MFDNHRAPSIPARATPPAALPPRLARTFGMAALFSLPLMLAASFGSASLWTVLLIGLIQTALAAVAALLMGGAHSPARVARDPRQGFTHG